jgi:hypothetical protein
MKNIVNCLKTLLGRVNDKPFKEWAMKDKELIGCFWESLDKKEYKKCHEISLKMNECWEEYRKNR